MNKLDFFLRCLKRRKKYSNENFIREITPHLEALKEIVKKQKTQNMYEDPEEFEKTIILSCKEIDALGNRLKTYFKWWLV